MNAELGTFGWHWAEKSRERRPMIIDGDGHYVELPMQWVEYVPAELRDRVYVTCLPDGTPERLVIEDFDTVIGLQEITVSGVRRGFGDAVTPGGYNADAPMGRHIGQGDPGGWSGEARLAVHDREGIDAAVMFPSVAPIILHRIADPKIARAIAEAINRWAAEMCAAAPHELYSTIVLPTQFPDLAAAELRRSVKEHAFVAGVFRPITLADRRSIDDRSYDPIWQTASDLGIPMTIHNVSTRETPAQAGTERYPGFTLNHAVAHPVEAMLAFASLLQGRVFQRFPALRVGFMESSCGWAPFWIERLEEHIEHFGWMEDPPLDADPKEIFVERCVIGCEGDEKMAPYVQSSLGEDKVLWSSDFPHFDIEPPFTSPVLSRVDMTDSQKEGLMWKAAANFYHLDVEAIARSKAKRQGARVSP